MANTTSAVKTFKSAVPTVNADGKVTSWKLSMEYSLNDYVSEFSQNVKIEEPSKAPEDYSKSELEALMNTEHWDAVYESQYTSVKVDVAPAETTVSDFDINNLK